MEEYVKDSVNASKDYDTMEIYYGELNDRIMRNSERKEFFDNGKEEGEKEKSLEIAKNMLNLGTKLSYVMEVTKLTKEEIEEKGLLKDYTEEQGNIDHSKEIYYGELNDRIMRNSERKEFFDNGKEEGLKEGEKSKSLEIAKKMLEKGMDLSLVSEITGLPLEEVSGLQ